MRYLRMLSNSVIAAGLASAYLTVLYLQVNPSVPIDLRTLGSIAAIAGVVYGVNLTIAFYALIVLRQILAIEVLSPGWLSVRLLSWLCATAAAGGATIMWLNLNAFGPVLDQTTRARMAVGTSLVSGAALVFLLIGLAHLGRRGGRMSATILSITMLASVTGPLLARGSGRAEPLPRPTTPAAESGHEREGARVTLLMFDGASLDAISPAVAAGRLPNIGRIFDQGAVLHLATLRPTQAEPVWSAIATGRLPMNNGVRSAVLYRAPGGVMLPILPDYCFAQALVRFGFLSEQPHTVADLTARPIWAILSDLGVRVGLIGWPLTHPAPEVNGLLISDTFHRLLESGVNEEETKGIWPSNLLVDALAALAVPANPDPVSLVSSLGAPQPSNDYDVRRDPAPVVADRVHLQLMNLLQAHQPQFLAARFPGIDAVGHLFLRYADPSAFGDVSEEERRRFGGVLDQYYGFVDTLVGREMEKLGRGDLLLVVSAFGMEPLSPGKRLLEMAVGNSQISGTHERAPDGFVLAFGSPVAPGRPARASLVDITPTVLYFLGLPVGADMEGFARTDIFRPAFTAENPVTFIPSYGR